MAKHIEEDIIAIVGLLCANIYWSGSDFYGAIENFSKSYGKIYPNDNLMDMFTKAFEAAKSAVPEVVEVMGQDKNNWHLLQNTAAFLQTAIENFNPDGSKKGGIFNGTLFKRSLNPVRDAEAAACAKIQLYSALVLSGRIKIADVERLIQKKR